MIRAVVQRRHGNRLHQSSGGSVFVQEHRAARIDERIHAISVSNDHEIAALQDGHQGPFFQRLETGPETGFDIRFADPAER